jgi:hypothetical protein
MASAQQLFDVVIDQLPQWGNANSYKQPITPDTEVYSDLVIYGDVLFELVLWLNKKFGVATNLDMRRVKRRFIGFKNSLALGNTTA